MNTQEFIDKWTDRPGEMAKMARDIEAMVADRIAENQKLTFGLTLALEACWKLEAERTQLRAECKAHAEASDALRAALKPFADNAEVWEPNESHFVLVYCRRGVKDQPDLLITVGDLLAAYDTLNNQT